MSHKILLGCYEVPGYGGANTASYRLFENMQQEGLNVSYVNIIDEQDIEFFTYCYGKDCGNPRHLSNVHNCVLENALFAPHPELTRLINAVSPTLLLADGYIATLLFKRAAPKKRVVYMTGGLIPVVGYLADRSRKNPFTFNEFLKKAREGLKVFHPFQKEAVEAADLIITHADMIRHLLIKIFPLAAGKVYDKIIWRAEWIARDAAPHTHLAKPFTERDIDLIFIASSWQRPEKNFRLLRQIVSRRRGASIHIVGEITIPPAGATCHGLITDRQKLFALLGRSKTFVSPSHFDSAPGVLWEASTMGCNVIAPKTCGNWMLCNEALVADPNQVNVFLEKIDKSLTGKFEDNMAFFTKARSFEDLVNTLEVM